MKTLKLALAGATFLIGASAVANAADVYTRGESLKDTGPVDYLPAITWTGFYIGANVGGTFDHTLTATVNGNEDEEFEGDNVGLAGVHLGYNWQTARNVVLGIEGDISVPFDSDDFAADYLATIRGRLGYAFGKSLIYATGGVAFLGEDRLGGDDTGTGWVVGAGFEHKLRSNLSVGLEGLYHNFEGDDYVSVKNDDVSDPERELWTVRARVTYHLDGGAHSEPLK